MINYWADIEKRIPAYIWDDAGCWLFTLDWRDPLLHEVQRYMNVVGTDINTVILTSPSKDWILKKIGSMPGSMDVRITKYRGMPAGYIGEAWPSRRWGRKAVGKRPDLKWSRKGRLEDFFSCRLPDDLYDIYGPVRKKYAKMVSAAMKQALKDKMEAIEKQKEKSKLPDANYSIYQQVYGDQVGK